MAHEIVLMLLAAPDHHLDESMQPLIQKWSDPPTPIQVLEVLDYCVHSSLASGLGMKMLHILYDDVCKANNVTHEDVVKDATWRLED
jgi:hypothetical protein